MFYPKVRLRRLRQSDYLRMAIAETSIRKEDLIYPIFVIQGEKIKKPVPSLPGVFQFSPDQLLLEIPKILSSGIKAIILFGIPKEKNATGSQAYNEQGIIQSTVKLIKKEFPEIFVITDVCLCGYTDHGHCGLVSENGEILNDESNALLAKTALSHCIAGADMVAPSDMMDGRVGAIRSILDENGYQNLPIMSYSAKYASAFYGPFRDAAASSPQFGNRDTYQMNPANSGEAIREAEQDLQEGADIIMVKPGLPYLDVVRRVKEKFNMPVAIYNVSGEYAMVKAAALKGWIDEAQVVQEILLSMKRAGADLIISYHALDMANWLKTEEVI